MLLGVGDGSALDGLVGPFESVLGGGVLLGVGDGSALDGLVGPSFLGLSMPLLFDGGSLGLGVGFIVVPRFFRALLTSSKEPSSFFSMGARLLSALTSFWVMPAILLATLATSATTWGTTQARPIPRVTDDLECPADQVANQFGDDVADQGAYRGHHLARDTNTAGRAVGGALRGGQEVGGVGGTLAIGVSGFAAPARGVAGDHVGQVRTDAAQFSGDVLPGFGVGFDLVGVAGECVQRIGQRSYVFYQPAARLRKRRRGPAPCLTRPARYLPRRERQRPSHHRRWLCSCR